MCWSSDPTPAAPGAARRWARALLTSWDIDDDHAEDVLLVLSELVANAVDHARTRLTVEMTLNDHIVLVAVSDASDQHPRLRPRDTRAQRGRGLQLVDALSLRWDSVSRMPRSGKTVRAQISCDAGRWPLPSPATRPARRQ